MRRTDWKGTLLRKNGGKFFNTYHSTSSVKSSKYGTINRCTIIIMPSSCSQSWACFHLQNNTAWCKCYWFSFEIHLEKWTSDVTGTTVVQISLNNLILVCHITRCLKLLVSCVCLSRVPNICAHSTLIYYCLVLCGRKNREAGDRNRCWKGAAIRLSTAGGSSRSVLFV